jgi:hypothetical protein
MLNPASLILIAILERQSSRGIHITKANAPGFSTRKHSLQTLHPEPPSPNLFPLRRGGRGVCDETVYRVTQDLRQDVLAVSTDYPVHERLCQERYTSNGSVSAELASSYCAPLIRPARTESEASVSSRISFWFRTFSLEQSYLVFLEKSCSENFVTRNDLHFLCEEGEDGRCHNHQDDGVF